MAATHDVFMTAAWRQLVLFNYPIDPDVLEPSVPPGTELDDFQGVNYASIVGFMFNDARLLGWSIPGHQSFAEVNLRFYVRRTVGDEIRRGVVFLREIVNRRAVAAVARWVYHEQYVVMPTRHAHTSYELRYAWRHRHRWCHLQAETDGDYAHPKTGSLEAFIVEHYWAYTRQTDGSVLEYRVAHPPWRVARVTAGSFDCDVSGIYGRVFEPYLTTHPPSAVVADGSPVEVYRGSKIPVPKGSSRSRYQLPEGKILSRSHD